jgi:hypothetical protein
MGQNSVILSGKAVFNRVMGQILGRTHQHDRVESVEYLEVFQELRQSIEDGVRRGTLRAYSTEKEGLEYITALTGRNDQGQEQDVYFRRGDLYDVLDAVVSETSPKSKDIFMIAFEKAAFECLTPQSDDVGAFTPMPYYTPRAQIRFAIREPEVQTLGRVAYKRHLGFV